MSKVVLDVTAEEAVILMIGGTGGGALPDIIDLEKPTLVEYKDIDSSTGEIIEHYKVGTDEEYELKIRVSFQNKGTPNEQVTYLYFYDKDGKYLDSISFSGFYVG